VDSTQRAGRTSTIIIVTGGDPVGPHEVGSLPVGALVVAADSGVGQAQRLGLRVDVAVGDFDSVEPADLERAIGLGASVERHAEAKEATDLELALEVALAHQPDRIVVIGGHGGRLDHLLANALLLACPRAAAVDIVAFLPPAKITVVRNGAELRGRPGELVSLLPVHGPARGVRTTGLLYPLAEEDLDEGSTRGVSNELAQPVATVMLTAGVLLAVQPGASGTHLARLAHRQPGRNP
jgi:thiamine pyrophosphokinase